MDRKIYRNLLTERRKGCGMSNKKSVTLRDIAEKTGVSINTVSHALKDKPDISVKTRERIKQVAQEMGYIGNASASFLRSGISKTIAIILGDISNPHFSIMVREIETFIREFGYTTFILNTEENEQNERQAIVSAVQKNVDGILWCPVQQSEDNLRFIRKTGVPFVLIGRRFPNRNVDYVVCDDANGGFVAADYLIQQGHREILFLNGPMHVSSAQERLLGYQGAYAKHGLDNPERLVYSGCARAGEASILLEKALGDNLSATAVLAFSDLIAWEAILTLNRMGLRVPEDISVVGFDNIQSQFLFPVLLTSVSSSKSAMAKAAAQLLLNRIEDKGGDPQHIVIPTKLIIRESVRRL